MGNAKRARLTAGQDQQADFTRRRNAGAEERREGG